MARAVLVTNGRPAVMTARAAVTLAVALVAATLVLIGLTWSDQTPTFAGSHAMDAALAVAFASYSGVGAFIVARRPDNRVGWIFLTSGLCLHLMMFSTRYALYGLVVRPGSLPIIDVVAWLSLWLVIPAFGLAFTMLLLAFPQGRFSSLRARVAAWFAAAAICFAAAAWALDPTTTDLYGQWANPVGIPLVARLDLPGLGWGLLLLAVLASVVSLVVRYVRSSGAQRRQLQWFAYAAALIGVTWLTITAASEWEPVEAVAELLFPLAVASLPVAAFIAIFRYDLYDIEVVISRTITFGVLAAFITAGYVVVVAGVGSVVGAAGESSLILAVLATALVAVAFQPVRARAQRLARRLVYGRRATPYEVLADFAHRLGEAPDAEDVLPQMARLLGQATGAIRADVWLVVGGELHLMAAWPAHPRRERVSLDHGELPALPEVSQVLQVRHRGRLLGAISLVVPPGWTLHPTERRLLTDLAAQAGLALDNNRLIEELKASRQRIVAAHDQERRRLERNIHDGVQQRLLALALMLRTRAESRTSDEVDTGAMRAAAGEARSILAELRGLARGIHPAIVTEGGLAAALQSLAERSPIPTEVSVHDVGALSETIEITIYYLVAEALANAIKHARASAVTVTVGRDSDRITVEVADDGVGGADASGSGLTGLADRTAALGGRLEVASPPDGGTRIRAEIPCVSS